MAKLNLIKIKCHTTEDWSGADEVRLKLNNTEVWRSDMNDNDELDLGIIRHFNYSMQVDLYDEDTGWFDDDDHFGSHSVYANEAGSGQKKMTFKADGAHYTIWYKVIVEISVLPEIDIWLEGIDFKSHEDPVTSEYDIRTEITLFGKQFVTEREKHGICSDWKWVPLGWHMGSHTMDFPDLVNNIHFGYYSRLKGIDSFFSGSGGHISFSINLDINPKGDIKVGSFAKSETSNLPDQFFVRSFNAPLSNTHGTPRFRIAIKIPGHLFDTHLNRVIEFVELFNNGLSNIMSTFNPFVVGPPVYGYKFPGTPSTTNRRVKVLSESATGRNEFFEDDQGRRMSRIEFVNAIKRKEYSGYTVRVINGVETPMSKADSDKTNNLDYKPKKAKSKTS
jgi:hypothetical protein